MNEMGLAVVIANDRVGLLAEVAYLLTKQGIRILSANAELVSGKVVFVFALSNLKAGVNLLNEANFNVQTSDLVVKLGSQPEEFTKLLARLSDGRVMLKRVSEIIRDAETVLLSLTVDKPKLALTILKDMLVGNYS